MPRGSGAENKELVDLPEPQRVQQRVAEECGAVAAPVAHAEQPQAADHRDDCQQREGDAGGAAAEQREGRREEQREGGIDGECERVRDRVARVLERGEMLEEARVIRVLRVQDRASGEVQVADEVVEEVDSTERHADDHDREQHGEQREQQDARDLPDRDQQRRWGGPFRDGPI